MIGQRLKIARAASGLSLRELEAAIDNLVTAQAIGKYERNEDMPSSKVLSALAKALHVSEDYLLASDELVLDGVEFRKKSIASKREEAFVEGQALHLLERYLDARRRARPRKCGVGSPARGSLSDYGRRGRRERGARRAHALGPRHRSDSKPVGTARRARNKNSSVGLSDIDGLTATVRRKNGEPIPVIVIKEDGMVGTKAFHARA